MVRLNQVRTLSFRNNREVVVPKNQSVNRLSYEAHHASGKMSEGYRQSSSSACGVLTASSFLVEELELASAEQEDTTHDQTGASVRVSL